MSGSVSIEIRLDIRYIPSLFIWLYHFRNEWWFAPGSKDNMPSIHSNWWIKAPKALEEICYYAYEDIPRPV